MIDWTKPLEAIHIDGRVAPVELDTGVKQPDSDGDYKLAMWEGPLYMEPDGNMVGGGAWTIRNRQSDSLASRMEQLIRRIADTDTAFDAQTEARAIVALLPETLEQRVTRMIASGASASDVIQTVRGDSV